MPTAGEPGQGRLVALAYCPPSRARCTSRLSPQRSPRREGPRRALRVRCPPLICVHHPFAPSLPCSPLNSRYNVRSKLSVTSDGGPPRRAVPAPSSSTPISPATPLVKPPTGLQQTTRAAARTTVIPKPAPPQPKMILSVSSGYLHVFTRSLHRRSSRSSSWSIRGRHLMVPQLPPRGGQTRWDQRGWGGSGRC